MTAPDYVNRLMDAELNGPILDYNRDISINLLKFRLLLIKTFRAGQEQERSK